MKKIGIFFGSDSGNTEKVANIILDTIGKKYCDLHNISKVKVDYFKKYNYLILGTSTSNYGKLQYDWIKFIPYLKKINFYKKKIYLFGCGDQENYPNHFCDSIYYLWKIIMNNKGNILGYWSSYEYKFKKSKSLLKNNKFIGLVIDEDKQKNKTLERIKKWLFFINLK